jgi:hypothetical protein
VNGENVLIKNRLVDSKSFYQIGCHGRPAWVVDSRGTTMGFSETSSTISLCTSYCVV